MVACTQNEPDTVTATLLLLVGIAILVMAVLGIATGKVVAGSKGLKANHYHREDGPLLYWGFVAVYLLTGSFTVYQAL